MSGSAKSVKMIKKVPFAAFFIGLWGFGGGVGFGCGCKGFGGGRLRICDCDGICRWYVINKRVE